MVWTGTKVLKNEDTDHRGVEILPTPVPSTRAGVAAGRDEGLERAVALVSG